jgi:uncharacterized protein with von Willebrand factor type A (vWA) domain
MGDANKIVIVGAVLDESERCLTAGEWIEAKYLRIAELERQLAEARDEGHWHKCWEAKCKESEHQYEEISRFESQLGEARAELEQAKELLDSTREFLEKQHGVKSWALNAAIGKTERIIAKLGDDHD